MDFKIVLESILKNFTKENIRYGLIGGFALGALGVPRSTVDLDFLVNRDDMDKIDCIMKDNGYTCAYKSDNVSQYVSALNIYGGIDFLHAFRTISLKMLDRAIEKEIFNGDFRIKVLRPEDVIGLKLQATVNDPKRLNGEYLDIESLMEHYRNDLDWNILNDYFALFGQEAKLAELKAKYDHAH